MKLLSTCIAIIMATTILSCNKPGSSSSEKDMAALNAAPIEVDKAEEKDLPAGNMIQTADSTGAVMHAGNPAANMDWDRKIIKDATVKLELKNYHAYDASLHNSLKRYGAYISDEQQNESDSKIENVMSIKVPVDKFEDLLNTLPAEGAKLLEKKISTQEVTGEVIDTKARIEAKKQVRERYLSLLKDAKNMKDILQVQGEVNNIQEDIEAGTGRVQYLVHQSAYSTINLTYYQYLLPGGDVSQEPTFFTKLTKAFADGTSIITGLVLLLITFWPIIAGGLLLWFIVRKRKLIVRHVLNKV